MTKRDTVVSLFDYTGEALRPWARAGYACYAFDLQHALQASGCSARIETFAGGGSIAYFHWDADGPEAWATIRNALALARRQCDVAFLFGFPPCTDLAVSGAKHWKRKAEADPEFQRKAARRAEFCSDAAGALGCPFAIENPRGALSRLWRKHDHTFNPCDFGGYLPADDVHPRWPDYIAPRDAYKKATNLWTGGGFVMPQPDRVEPERIAVGNKAGSRQWARLGGNSAKTKNIRSATPRGFALAVYHANH